MSNKMSTASAPAGSLQFDLAGFHWPDWIHQFANDAALRIEGFDEDHVHVMRAEMPGIDPDKDVDLSVDNGVLSIRAERREEEKTEQQNGYRSEFTYGAFARTVRLPVGATQDDVKANYSDGILEIRFPVDDEKAEARKVPITGS